MAKPQTYAGLTKQIEALKGKAEAMRKREIAGVVARIKAAINAYGLTAQDLGLGGGVGVAKGHARQSKAKTVATLKRSGAKGSKIAVKYRDAAGNTWTGRGSKPRWLVAALTTGALLQKFAVGAPSPKSKPAGKGTKKPSPASAAIFTDGAGHS